MAASKPSPAATPLKLGCVFFKTATGNEPVRDWLLDLPTAARKTIGSDIKAVQAEWPVGPPLVKNVDGGLWEVRSSHNGVEHRTFFVIDGSAMVLVHGIIKKSQKTPKSELDLARQRQASLEKKP